MTPSGRRPTGKLLSSRISYAVLASSTEQKTGVECIRIALIRTTARDELITSISNGSLGCRSLNLGQVLL